MRKRLRFKSLFTESLAFCCNSLFVIRWGTSAYFGHVEDQTLLNISHEDTFFIKNNAKSSFMCGKSYLWPVVFLNPLTHIKHEQITRLWTELIFLSIITLTTHYTEQCKWLHFNSQNPSFDLSGGSYVHLIRTKNLSWSVKAWSHCTEHKIWRNVNENCITASWHE